MCLVVYTDIVSMRSAYLILGDKYTVSMHRVCLILGYKIHYFNAQYLLSLDYKYTVSPQSVCLILTAGVAGLVRRVKEKRVTYTTCIHYGQPNLSTLLNSIASCGCRFLQLSEIEIRHPDDPDQVNQDLSKLVNTETRIILLFAHE